MSVGDADVREGEGEGDVAVARRWAMDDTVCDAKQEETVTSERRAAGG